MRNFIDAICYPFRLLARIPSSLISSPTRLLGMSLPLRVAILLGLGLLLVVIGWTVMIVTLDSSEQVETFLWRELPALLTLVFVIPVIVCFALKLWLDGPPSPFPEIDRDWQTALEAMAEQKIDPADTPIFLVLGLAGPESVPRLMGGSMIEGGAHAPRGLAELQVWANHDAIFVHCLKTSCLSTLLSEGVSESDAPATAGQPDYAGTMVVGGSAAGESSSASVGGGGEKELFSSTQPVSPFGIGEADPGTLREEDDAAGPTGTQMIDADSAARLTPRPNREGGGPTSGGPPAGGYQGTMRVGDVDPAPGPSTDMASKTPSRRLSPTQIEIAKEKLAYLCDRLRRAREPMVPINGVITMTPFDILVDGSDRSVDRLRTALSTDMATLRRHTRMRCGVTHLINGMQSEAGFLELIQRFNPQRAKTRRIGKGFDLSGVPTVAELEKVAALACGSIEDWIYSFFGQEDQLGRRGNRRMYELACRVRGRFQSRLGTLLRSAYAVDPKAVDPINREPLMFSGCYFAADGSGPDQQAFLAGVFDKPTAEQGELQWGGEAIARERRFQTLVQAFLILNGILIATIIALLIYLANP